MDKLNFCLDLGNSSLKVCFGIQSDSGTRYGKITENTPLLPSYIPSIAFFDEEIGDWVFGAEIDKRKANSLATIVKIKDLLSLLMDGKDEQATQKNREGYCFGTDFPKFIFPPIPELKNYEMDLAYLTENDYSFSSPITPQQLCERFFSFVHGIVTDRIEQINRKFGTDIRQYTVSLVYPDNATKEYTQEYIRLVEKAFHKTIKKKISSTRALTYYARLQGKILPGEEFLVFDIGDGNISVSKGMLNDDGNILIDGIDGHREPMSIGGNDIDEKIVDLIESKIEKSETIGSPSFGNNGHISERGLLTKQFLLTKNIKDAKVVLSSEDPLFQSVTDMPIDINREVFYQVDLTRRELLECSGVLHKDGEVGIAYRFAEFIVDELDRVINRGVSKVLIAGGVIETLGLFDYLRERVPKMSANHSDIEFFTFERKDNENDLLGISESEDSSYAAAIGGCYVALFDIPIRLCLSLTFATNYVDPTTRERFARVFAGKGTELNEFGETTFYLDGFCETPCDEEIYSLQVSEEDIERKRIMGVDYSGRKLLVYSPNTIGRKKAMIYAGLKVVLTNEIRLRHGRKRVRQITPKYPFREGIRVDEDGHAEIFIEPRIDSPRMAEVVYEDGTWSRVNMGQIDIAFGDSNIGFETNSRK